jgi:hypothetical protein
MLIYSSLLIPGFQALASPGAAHCLGNVHASGVFFFEMVGGQY